MIAVNASLGGNMGTKMRSKSVAGRLVGRGVAAGFAMLQGCSDAHTDDTPRDASVDGAAMDANTSDARVLDATVSDAMADAAWDFDAGAIDGGDGRTLFANDAVHFETVARRVLYSWTTDEQYEALRRDQVLLTRTERPGTGPANIRSVLASMAAGGDALATVLTGEGFQKARFAWPAPWATILGWEGESYGRRLIRIVLKESAWIVRLEQGVFTVVDAFNVPVAIEAALASPERIGAVYYVNEGEGDFYCGGTFGSGCPTGTYREYFVNNPQMIEEWSLETRTIQRELARNIQTIEAFAKTRDNSGIDSGQCAVTHNALCAWRGTPEWADAASYYAALCITSTMYSPSAYHMDLLAQALREAWFEPNPLVVRP